MNKILARARYGSAPKHSYKSKKKRMPHYITKEDIKAKGENESWESYFRNKEALKKIQNKNKNDRMDGTRAQRREAKR